MSSRDDQAYEDIKEVLDRDLEDIANRIQTLDNELARSIELADDVAVLLCAVEDNPFLEHHFFIRKLIRNLIPTSNLMEMCIDVQLEKLVNAVRTSLTDILGNNITLLETDISTSVRDLLRSAYRIDHLVVSQKASVRVLGAGSEIDVVVHQPFFIRLSDTGQIQISALTTPIVVSDFGAVGPSIQALVVKELFGGRLKSSLPLSTPSGFSSLNLIPFATKLEAGISRLYYSKQPNTAYSGDADFPIPARRWIGIKLTVKLLADMFVDRVRQQLAASGIEMRSFGVICYSATQTVTVMIVGSREVSGKIMNIRFWGKGFAKVRQSIRFEIGPVGQLVVSSIGNPVLDGEAWVGEAGAHVDTAIGGGFGVNLPNEAVDILWDFAKALGIRLPTQIEATSFNESIDLMPFNLKTVDVRSDSVMLMINIG